MIALLTLNTKASQQLEACTSPKIGNVRIKLHRELEGKVKTCTVKRDRCGDWYVVFSCEITAQAVTQPAKQVGIE
ncbi:MAG: hypothetical protein R2880_18955 [Deinococcales bacterium]